MFIQTKNHLPGRSRGAKIVGNETGQSPGRQVQEHGEFHGLTPISAIQGTILCTQGKAVGLETTASWACASPGVSSFLTQHIVLATQEKQYQLGAYRFHPR